MDWLDLLEVQRTLLQHYSSKASILQHWAFFSTELSGSDGKASAYNAGDLQWVQSPGREDLLEQEMATHSSILAWKIPWMEEPGRLQFMGLQRVGHDWETSLTHSLTFFIVQISHPYMTTGKTIALTRWTFVGKVMSLLFNILSRWILKIY